jgi:hypothetical protein
MVVPVFVTGQGGQLLLSPVFMVIQLRADAVRAETGVRAVHDAACGYGTREAAVVGGLGKPVDHVTGVIAVFTIKQGAVALRGFQLVTEFGVQPGQYGIMQRRVQQQVELVRMVIDIFIVQLRGISPVRESPLLWRHR